ncbi:hypothetical protein ILUMI_00436 [Ignelater luminosus]|uniref:Uncharacterized protein n=1 Tax=Ignelater luminosus TaxID=2038154 RepID=A0A8K0DGF1_IGNLU|nr:hypothetical protein ILUMI_00436 [Ignelater luminosus]
MGTSDNVSYVTILKPREPDYTESSRITTDFLIELESLIDRNKWENRREFFFQTLAFCLSLPNLWRFPREALTQGHAAFVWLYILFMVSIGSSLLFFEVALGQYSSKGFTKVFAMCPLFEGISYAMALYCMMASTYYNVLNAYSFIYLFASFNTTLEYAKCFSFPSEICVEGTTNQTLSPENVYFHHRIVYYTVDNFNKSNFYKPSWRNMGVLFFLWVLVCIVIFRGILRAKWPAMVYCPLPYLVLSITLFIVLSVNGSLTGLKAMFALKFKSLLNTNVSIP